jgi:acetoin utilization deacetylase AcuC-like enzyme
MAAMTGFLLHEASPLHDTGWRHPEHQGRLRALSSSVGRDLLELHDRVVQHAPETASVEDLLRVHTPEMIERIREAVDLAQRDEAVVNLDVDTVVSGASWDALMGSVGALISACRATSEGVIANAFVATRPPGHHATPGTSMGFCLVNNVAVAARWLQAQGLAERVLIIDWDVHHGNGTQDAFYDDATVTYLSLHQWPHYPGTGAADETGVGAGEGYTFNVPLPAGTLATDYRDFFERALDCAWSAANPDFLLISAGFDALRGDPLGGLLLEPDDFHALTRIVVERAGAGVPVVGALEGGYDPRRTGVAAVNVLRALAGVDSTS